MAKLNVKKYEERLSFLENELYVKRDQLNELYHDAGMQNVYHNFLFETSDIRDAYEDAELDVAHMIRSVGDYGADVTLQGKIRNTTEEINTLLEQASRIGIRLDLAQDILYLDTLPANDEEEYTGRWAVVLEIRAPNLDDSI